MRETIRCQVECEETEVEQLLAQWELDPAMLLADFCDRIDSARELLTEGGEQERKRALGVLAGLSHEVHSLMEAV